MTESGATPTSVRVPVVGGPEVTRDLTVASVLTLPVIRRGCPRVVAGHDHMDRSVRWVHSTDATNVAALLNGGELVLTTGAGLGSRPGAQRRYLAGLADTCAAGLIVELGHELTELPPAAQVAAEELGLPVVILHKPVRFVEVTESVHTEIINFRYEVMRWGEELQRQMLDLLLTDEGLPAVLDRLAEALRSPVFLETYDHRLLYHADGPGSDTGPLDLWAGLQAAMVAGDDVKDLIASPVPMGADAEAGRLVALRPEGVAPAFPEAGVERAAALIALMLLRARQSEELARRERGNFVSGLAKRRISAEDAERHARSVGLEPDLDLMVPLAAEVRRHGGLDEQAWQEILERIEARLSDKAIRIVIGSDRAGVLLAIAGVRRGGERSTVAETVAVVTRAAVSASLGDADVAIVVGGPAEWPAVGRSLQLAADGAASAFALPNQPWYDLHALEAERLLWRWRDDEELQAVVDRTLGPLLRHDEQSSNSLLPTLEALLAHGGRKSEAARALHLNRQALYGRLKRIQELIELDLDQADQRLIVHLAVRARRQMLARR